MKKVAAAVFVAKTLTEDQAAEVIWAFYRDNKAALMTDIKEHRDFILAELVRGVPATQVFAQFVALPAPTTPARRTR